MTTAPGGSNPSVTVVFGPSHNEVIFGKLQLNKKRGTAILPLTLPTSGLVALFGKGLLTVAQQQGPHGGTVSLPITPVGKTKKRLDQKHKATLSATIIFAPENGPSSTNTETLKLVKK